MLDKPDYAGTLAGNDELQSDLNSTREKHKKLIRTCTSREQHQICQVARQGARIGPNIPPAAAQSSRSKNLVNPSLVDWWIGGLVD